MANKVAAVEAPKCVVHTDVHRGNQDVVFTQLLQYGGNSFRITIRSDSYLEQSHGVIAVWRDEWVEIWRLAGPLLAVGKGLAYKTGSDGRPVNLEPQFTMDRNKLFALAMKVLES